MAVGESELAGDRCTVHGGSDNNEEVNKGKKALLGPDKDAISISQDHELFSGGHGSSDSSSLFSSEESSEDFIEVDVENVGSTSPPIEERIPTTQMMERDGRIPDDVFVTSESLAPAEWSVVSNESLFSIQQGASSLGRDQTLMVVASKMCILEDPNKPNELPFSPPPASVEPCHDKTKQCSGKKKAPKAAAQPSDSSHRSNGSESSSYSFAFPVLVPEVQQNGTTKADGGNHQKKNSHHMGEDNSISRPSPPPPPPQKKSCWRCCLSFRVCFPCSSCRPSH